MMGKYSAIYLCEREREREIEIFTRREREILQEK